MQRDLSGSCKKYLEPHRSLKSCGTNPRGSSCTERSRWRVQQSCLLTAQKNTPPCRQACSFMSKMLTSHTGKLSRLVPHPSMSLLINLMAEAAGCRIRTEIPGGLPHSNSNRIKKGK